MLSLFSSTIIFKNLNDKKIIILNSSKEAVHCLFRPLTRRSNTEESRQQYIAETEESRQQYIAEFAAIGPWAFQPRGGVARVHFTIDSGLDTYCDPRRLQMHYGGRWKYLHHKQASKFEYWRRWGNGGCDSSHKRFIVGCRRYGGGKCFIQEYTN